MRRTIALVVMLALPAAAHTDTRPRVRDADLLACDLIVVARIEGDTIQQTDHHTDVKLIVAETLRGEAPGKIIDVRIQPLVVVGGLYNRGGRNIDVRGLEKKYPKTRIVIVDGHYGEWDSTLDLSKNAFWFLRKAKDERRYVASRNEYVQAASLRPYFSALRSARS